jgi:cobalt-precorrin 5A hydrolase
MIVLGIGCRTGVSAEDVVALVREATSSIVRPAGADDVALAVPDFRCTEPNIATAAMALGLPILWIARAALKGEQGRCLTRSARAEAEIGLSCVAEAAALCGAGPGSRLLLPRIAGKGVTCAVAEGPGG